MRYLILFFAFLSPITLLAQSEGTVEYSVTTEMKMDMETIMANMPEEMQLDSAMVAQMAQTFENMGNQQVTGTVLLHFSGAQALTEVVMPDLPNPMPNVSPFGSFDNSIGVTTYFDFDEQIRITKMPNAGESVPYVVSIELNPIDAVDWVLSDVDSTILGHAVKKAEFISDSLEAVVWYAPGIGSIAGPDQFGNLPGLPLSIDATMSQNMNMKMTYVAKSITEGLEEPITPPIGISVTQEEYMKILMEKMGDMQFVP
ncbi:MAG: GLPGLI family protein [Bacteroidota bacterium]|nr:GLPGLI family protein [Bacteroidota bacterium]